MRRFIVSIATAAALLTAAMPGEALGQGGNIGGTIGKKNKTVTGGDDQPAPPDKNSRPAKRRAATDQSVPVGRDSCKSLVGTWAWFLGPQAVFAADRTVSHLQGYTGKWTCSKGAVVIVWNHGVTDRGTLSDDGKTLAVASGIGINFQATRH